MLYSPPLTRSRARLHGKHPSLQKSIDKLNAIYARRHRRAARACTKDNIDLESVSLKALQASSPSILNKRKRALKLSREEQAMAGAPEGNVYQVEVLERKDVPPPEAPQDDLQLVLLAAGPSAATLDWGDTYAAVDALRRLAIHSPQTLLNGGAAVLAAALQLTKEGAGSLRSSMARNSLLALEDLFDFVGGPVLGEPEVATTLVSLLLGLAGGDKKFLRGTAQSTVDALARAAPGADTVAAFVAHAEDKNTEVQAQALLRADKALEEWLGGLAPGAARRGAAAALLGRAAAARGLSAGVRARAPAGREAARRALGRLRRALAAGGPAGGPAAAAAAAFEAALAAAVGAEEAARLCREVGGAPKNKAAAVRPGGLAAAPWKKCGAAAAAGGGKAAAAAGGKSIREKMMEAQRAKLQSRDPNSSNQQLTQQSEEKNNTNKAVLMVF